MNLILFLAMVMLVAVAGADGSRDNPYWMRWAIPAGAVALIFAAGWTQRLVVTRVSGKNRLDQDGPRP